MKLSATLLTALFAATTVVAAPIDSRSTKPNAMLAERSGPSGTLISPTGSFGTVLNGGVIPIVYKGVNAGWTATYKIDVTLIRKSHGYEHVLASGLTFAKSTSNNIIGHFRVPRDILTSGGSFGSDYQVQIKEYQTNPDDTSQLDSVTPFISAAPYITISYAG